MVDFSVKMRLHRSLDQRVWSGRKHVDAAEKETPVETRVVVKAGLGMVGIEQEPNRWKVCILLIH